MGDLLSLDQAANLALQVFAKTDKEIQDVRSADNRELTAMMANESDKKLCASAQVYCSDAKYFVAAISNDACDFRFLFLPDREM